MFVNITFHSSMKDFLPSGETSPNFTLEFDDSPSYHDIMQRLNLPDDFIPLVKVNGQYIAPQKRNDYGLKADDHIEFWPPIIGG